MIPDLRKFAWAGYLGQVTIFKLYDPGDAITSAQTLGARIAILAGIVLACILLAFVGFIYRDLPANG